MILLSVGAKILALVYLKYAPPSVSEIFRFVCCRRVATYEQRVIRTYFLHCYFRGKTPFLSVSGCPGYFYWLRAAPLGWGNVVLLG